MCCPFGFYLSVKLFISQRQILKGILAASSCHVVLSLWNMLRNKWLVIERSQWHGCIKWYYCLALPCDWMLPARSQLKMYCTMMYVAHMITDLSRPTVSDYLLPSYRDRPDPREKRYASICISTTPLDKSMHCMDVFFTFIYRQTASERHTCTHTLTHTTSQVFPPSPSHVHAFTARPSNEPYITCSYVGAHVSPHILTSRH